MTEREVKAKKIYLCEFDYNLVAEAIREKIHDCYGQCNYEAAMNYETIYADLQEQEWETINLWQI